MIVTGIDDQSAKKELKSGSLAPPLPSRAARRHQLITKRIELPKFRIIVPNIQRKFKHYH
jgi:hypothetical protein